jgi:hypothetical protein
VTWSFASGDQKVKQFVGATGKQSGHAVTATNLPTNGAVLVGMSTMFTFTGDGNAAKVNPSLTCKAR